MIIIQKPPLPYAARAVCYLLLRNPTAAMIAAGLDLKEAVRIANQAGGIVVGKLGTASVTYEELFGKGN